VTDAEVFRLLESARKILARGFEAQRLLLEELAAE
jgi:hypothetical protein